MVSGSGGGSQGRQVQYIYRVVHATHTACAQLPHGAVMYSCIWLACPATIHVSGWPGLACPDFSDPSRREVPGEIHL